MVDLYCVVWKDAQGGSNAGWREVEELTKIKVATACLLYTSPSPRDVEESRMPSSA